jgi:Tol biopolymer transport system component
MSICMIFLSCDMSTKNQIDKNNNVGSNFHKVKDPYLGQEPPGTMPEIFAPGIISTEKFNEYGGHFSPSGKEFYFTRFGKDIDGGLFNTKLENGKWSRPTILSFMREFPGAESCLSFDGSKLYYIWIGVDSIEPVNDIFFVNRKGEDWGIPEQLTKTNLGERRICPSVSKNGNLYYSGNVDNKDDKDIYCSVLVDGEYKNPINLGSAVNSEYFEEHVYIAPDESYIIFDSYRPEGEGSVDLYISYRNGDGTWSNAMNPGVPINSKAADWYPKISPDGKYLFYSRNIDGNNDIYWVDAKVIKDLKPQELKD